MGFKEKLLSIIAKEPNQLTEEEFRYLVSRIGYLSDTERAKFAPILKKPRLTKDEFEKYSELQTLDLYFT